MSRIVKTLIAIFVFSRTPVMAETQGFEIDVAESVLLVDTLSAIESSPECDIWSDSLTSNRNTKANELTCNRRKNIYELPYSFSGRCYDWHRIWLNTATLGGAFVGTLLVLECLPEDATSWNRAELQDVPLFKRWYNHVIKKGPEWDHDKFYFNYILHPYAGAVYYMTTRSCGFNAWQSLLYCSIISNIGWEFGIEAFMERPSIQDMLITPLIGSAIGEGFYHIKRHIVKHEYTLAGSKILGNIVVFMIDPVNEIVGLFAGNPCRQLARQQSRVEVSSSFLLPTSPIRTFGFSITCKY